MRSLLKVFRPSLFLFIGITLALLSAALNPLKPYDQGLTPTPLLITSTPSPTPTPTSEAGTTDGILLLAAVLVLIVIVPIVWKRRTWMRNLSIL